jgi:hypothetical protein
MCHISLIYGKSTLSMPFESCWLKRALRGLQGRLRGWRGPYTDTPIRTNAVWKEWKCGRQQLIEIGKYAYLVWSPGFGILFFQWFHSYSIFLIALLCISVK